MQQLAILAREAFLRTKTEDNIIHRVELVCTSYFNSLYPNLICPFASHWCILKSSILVPSSPYTGSGDLLNPPRAVHCKRGIQYHLMDFNICSATRPFPQVKPSSIGNYNWLHRFKDFCHYSFSTHTGVWPIISRSHSVYMTDQRNLTSSTPWCGIVHTDVNSSRAR